MTALPGRERPLTGVGLAAVVAALVWALAVGGGAVGGGAAGAGAGAAAPVSTLAGIGLVLVVADAVLGVLEARTGLGLDVPAGVAVPAPRWWWPLSLAAATALTAGVLAAAPVALVTGGLSLVLAAAGAAAGARSAPDRLDRRVVRAALEVRAFAERQGMGPDERLTGFAVPLGARWTRLVVVGRDGTWGDVVVPAADPPAPAPAAAPAPAPAAAMVATLARVDLAPAGDPGPALTLRTGPSAWAAMVRGR